MDRAPHSEEIYVGLHDDAGDSSFTTAFTAKIDV